jgi:hypothetical protein
VCCPHPLFFSPLVLNGGYREKPEQGMFKFHFILIIALLCTGKVLSAQDLKNPLVLDNEWSGYSIGDPYVLKHRGVFYLYCSTKDSETGVKCWSSRDLVNWEYGGLCSTSAITRGAYAPEVIYWNGTFYMYTSPAGNGHYVLSAPSPTGPFEPVTGNLGKFLSTITRRCISTMPPPQGSRDAVCPAPPLSG